MKKATYFYLLRRGFFGGGLPPNIKAYKSRVESDGGTFENQVCLLDKYRNLSAITLLFYGTVSDFENRVITDGGTFEGALCVREKLINTF